MNIHRIAFSKDFEYDMKQTVGFHAGAVVDVKIYNELYVQFGILYSSRGGSYKERFYYVYNDGSRAPVDHTYETTVESHYLEFQPLTIQYRFPISRSSRISIEAGPYLAVGVSGETQHKERYKYLGNSRAADKVVPTFYSENNRHEECYGLKRFDAGLRFGGGFHIDHFYLGLNYSLGLQNLYEKKARTAWATQDDVQITNSSLSITAGYNF
jgi:hypothetical protein